MKSKQKQKTLVGVYLPPSYIEGLDRLVEEKLYPHRNEAIRLAIRDLLKYHKLTENEESDFCDSCGKGRIVDVIEYNGNPLGVCWRCWDELATFQKKIQKKK
jgi:Arc/MetJ-type ribon-helix-helix transcriptional regulator